jgi:hypothetical protein
MEQNDKTPNKRPAKPFRGAIDGVPFTSENQPSPEAKKKGWEERRKEQLLTKSILKYILGPNFDDDAKLDEYPEIIWNLAKDGNSKAIETINKALEDDIHKVQHSGQITQTQIIYQLSSGNEPIEDK